MVRIGRAASDFPHHELTGVTMTPTSQRGNRRRANIRQLLSKYQLDKVRLNLKFISGEITFNNADADAAWELYIEMLTRIVTQPLPSRAR